VDALIVDAEQLNRVAGDYK
jgi:hypothetical protein